MPLLDKPLEELLKYEGRNPRPADHDAYWARALAEMRAVEPKVELVPADFQVPFAQCYHYYFTGVKGARIHAKLLRPKMQTGPGPALVNFHGYCGRSSEWNQYLAFVGAGFTVAAMDCRGQAGRSEDTGGVQGTTNRGHIIRGLNDENPDNLFFRQVFLDAAQLAGLVMDMDNVDAGRVGAFGPSQGGALTVACAALEPRIQRAASTFPWLSDYRRVWEMDLCKDNKPYDQIRVFFRNFDPTHEREDHWFTKLGYIDIQFLASRIEGEVLMGIGLMDDICPPSSQYACYNKIRSKKSTVIYPDFGHEGLPDFDDRVFSFLMGL